MSTVRATPFTEGSAVRLSLDSGPASIGILGPADHTRSDGVTFYVVDFDPEHLTEPMLLPETILVPVCEYEHPFTDFDGSSAWMPCRFDATFTFTDEFGGVNLCTEHADELVHGADFDGYAVSRI